VGWDRIPDWGSVFHSDVGVVLWGMNFDFTFLDALTLQIWNFFHNLHIQKQIIGKLGE
jgi:hypothetical protein